MAAGIIVGLGEHIAEQNKREFEIQQERRRDMMEFLKTATEAQNVPGWYQDEARQLWLDFAMTPPDKKLNKQLEQRFNDFMLAHERYQRSGDQQRQQVRQQVAGKVLGAPVGNALSRISLRNMPALPGGRAQRITEPGQFDLQDFPTPPTSQNLRAQMAGTGASPVRQVGPQSSLSLGEQAAQEKLDQAVSQAIAVARAQGVVSIENEQAVQENAKRMVQSLPGWPQMSPQEQFNASFAAIFQMNLPSTSGSSAAGLGAQESFVSKKDGETYTGVPDRINGGYWVRTSEGQSFFPFGETEEFVGDRPIGTLYPVMKDGQMLYLPADQASGLPVGRTTYDIYGNPSTGGVAGLSTTPPPTPPQGIIDTIAGIDYSLTRLQRVSSMLSDPTVQQSMGPIAGRVTMAQIAAGGGAGLDPKAMEFAALLSDQMRSQAFEQAGANLAQHEKAMFDRTIPIESDTVANAFVKTRLAIELLKADRETYFNNLPIRLRNQLQSEPQIPDLPSPPSGNGNANTRWTYDPESDELRAQ